MWPSEALKHLEQAYLYSQRGAGGGGGGGESCAGFLQSPGSCALVQGAFVLGSLHGQDKPAHVP